MKAASGWPSGTRFHYSGTVSRPALADTDVDVDTPADVMAWLADATGRAVILSLVGESDWAHAHGAQISNTL